MKKIIIKLLMTGYSTTKKYTVNDLENYLWILKGLFKDTQKGIAANQENPFWSNENNARVDLIRDIMNITRRSVKDHYYYRILNRCANGDAYNIPYHKELRGL